MEQIGEYRGGEDIHDTVVMENVCHVIVDDVGMIMSFGKKKERKNIENIGRNMSIQHI